MPLLLLSYLGCAHAQLAPAPAPVPGPLVATGAAPAAAAAPGTDPADAAALALLFTSVGLPPPGPNPCGEAGSINCSGNSLDACAWSHIVCVGGHVVAVRLEGASLQGTLPPAFAMGQLRALNLRGNRCEQRALAGDRRCSAGGAAARARGVSRRSPPAPAPPAAGCMAHCRRSGARASCRS